MTKKLIMFFFLILLILTSCEYQVLDLYNEGADYNLRDRGPAGGWIFYENPDWEADGWKYLEAAPVDQSSGTTWMNPVSYIGAIGTGIGTGKANTDLIISATTSSAKSCRDYRGGGYDDWFLPSRDELLKIYDNLMVYSVGGFLSINGYWSSSESDASNAITVYFINGSPSSTSKNSSNHVRAIRRF
ncbi:MAG: DUF1566 domain-containing protein [Spirochaetes bacterium]|nr:DUF1566 domain-containing protein [Spirochaetota bacterium]